VTIPDDDRTWTRLADAFAGRASAAERAELERWLAEDPHRREEVESLRTVWDRAGSLPEPVGPVNVRAAWAALAERIHEPDAAAADRRSRPVPLASLAPRPSARHTALKVAAALLLIGGATWLVRSADLPGRGTMAQGTDREVSTGTGQRAALRLDDGTQVLLGVRSTLRWGRGFGDRAREVHLTGEALFTVAHDAARPFRVHAGDALMEDLGTEFSVRGYPGDDRVVVAVRSGQVSMGRGDSAGVPAALLEPGDLGTLRTGGRPTVEHGLDLGPYLAFAEGRLVFSDTPLPDAIAQVQRWYDVQVTIADSSLAGARVNATFHDEPLPDVLQVLATSLGARYEQRGRMVWLRAR
jgi:transmembrane sensor